MGWAILVVAMTMAMFTKIFLKEGTMCHISIGCKLYNSLSSKKNN